MFSFFRRRRRSSLTLFDPGPGADGVSDVAQVARAEAATEEPEQEKVVLAESKLEKLPLVSREAHELVDPAPPVRFAPASPAVPNLYAIWNPGVKFAAALPQTTVEAGSDPSRAENLVEKPIAEDENATDEGNCAGGEVISVPDESTPQAPEEIASVELDANLAFSALEGLLEAPIAGEEAHATEEPVAAEEAIISEETFAAEPPAEEAPCEPDTNLETPAVEASPVQPYAAEQPGAATESVAAEETPAMADTPAPAEKAIADESGADIATLSEVPADEFSVAESAAELIAMNPEAPSIEESVQTAVGSDVSETPKMESPVIESLPETARAPQLKPKRRWWQFWRKRMPVEAYVAEPVAESSALETSVVNAGGEVSTAEEIVSEQEVAAGQLPSTDTAHAGLPSVESPATEAPVAASAADISSVTSKLLDGIEIELAADGLVIRETAEAESPRDVPPDGDHTVVEPAEAEWQPKIIPATENTSEIVALENQAPEAVADENVATAEKSAAIQNVEVDWEENQSEAVAPPPDEIGQNATDVESSLVEPLGIEAVAEAESGSEAEETLATRTVDTPPVNDSLSIEPPGADSTEVEPQTGVEEASPDVSEVGTDTSIGQKGMPESDNNLESKEKAPAHVSDARAGRVLSGPSEGASRKSLAGHGIFNLPRVPEPEVMDDAEQVEAYASAAAQEWLNKIDDSFVEHASRLVQGRPRGRALDIGAGPGQIALKLALKLSLWKIIGVDRSQKMIDEALAKLTASPAATGRLEFRVADGNRLDFPNATFELVICNSVLHHLAEPQKLLSELARVAKPRGAILLRDLRRPSRLQYALHVRWHGRHYAGKMFQLYRDSVRAAYTVPELQKLLNVSPLRGARVFRHGSTHIGIERPYNS